MLGWRKPNHPRGARPLARVGPELNVYKMNQGCVKSMVKGCNGWKGRVGWELGVHIKTKGESHLGCRQKVTYSFIIINWRGMK